jgi:hypothetical protein
LLESPRRRYARQIIPRSNSSIAKASNLSETQVRSFRRWRGYDEEDLELADQMGYARAAESSILGNYDQLRIDLEQQRSLGAPRTERDKNLPALQRQFWDLWHIEPTVKNAVTMQTALITGGGVFIEIPEDQEHGKALKERWTEFDRANRYTSRTVWKNVHDTLLMGEVVNWFDRSLNNPNEERRGAPSRIMPLDFISKGGISSIKTHPQNPFLVTHYTRRGSYDALVPDEVTHWKAPAAGNQIHGRPVLESAIDDIWRVRQSGVTLWMRQEWLQRTFAFIYKIVNPDLADKLPDRLPLPEGLEGIEVPAGVDLEIPGLKDSAVASGRFDDTAVTASLLRICQAIQLPYHILTMRYNEANFASLLSAEGPQVKIAEYWATVFEEFVEMDVRKVVGQDAEIFVDIRPTVFRDHAAERVSITELLLANVLDMRTAREQLGYDHDEIERRLSGEEEESEEEPIAPEETEDEEIAAEEAA